MWNDVERLVYRRMWRIPHTPLGDALAGWRSFSVSGCWKWWSTSPAIRNSQGNAVDFAAMFGWTKQFWVDLDSQSSCENKTRGANANWKLAFCSRIVHNSHGLMGQVSKDFSSDSYRHSCPPSFHLTFHLTCHLTFHPYLCHLFFLCLWICPSLCLYHLSRPFRSSWVFWLLPPLPSQRAYLFSPQRTPKYYLWLQTFCKVLLPCVPSSSPVWRCKSWLMGNRTSSRPTLPLWVWSVSLGAPEAATAVPWRAPGAPVSPRVSEVWDLRHPAGRGRCWADPARSFSGSGWFQHVWW